MDTSELKLKIFREIDSLDQGKLQEVYGNIQNLLENSENGGKVIFNKGFSGFRGVSTRSKFCCSLISKKPGIPYYPYRQPLDVILGCINKSK